MAKGRPRKYSEQADGSMEADQDPMDDTVSPNSRPIEEGEAMSSQDMMSALAGAGEGGGEGGGASQPLDLSQLVMMLSMRMGMSRVSDELIYTLFFAILGTSVNEQELFKNTNKLPERMPYGEAKARMRNEMRGSGFPMVQLLIAEMNGKVDDYIDREYFRKLVNKNIPIMRNLKQQGILNWGQMVGQGGMGLMPMDLENFQLSSVLNPKYRQYVNTGEV